MPRSNFVARAGLHLDKMKGKYSMKTATYDLEEAIDASHTVKELAEYLGVHPQTVYKRAKTDERYQGAIERIRAKGNAMTALTVRLPDSLLSWLECKARQEETTVSDVVRDWLVRHPGYVEKKS